MTFKIESTNPSINVIKNYLTPLISEQSQKILIVMVTVFALLAACYVAYRLFVKKVYSAGESPSEKMMRVDLFRTIIAPELSLSDLRNCALVCRTWSAVAQPVINDRLTKKRQAMTFGPEDWKYHGFNIGPAESFPSLPDDIDTRFKELCTFIPNVMVDVPDWKNHWPMLVLIPKEINGEPLTINRFGTLMRHLREGNYSSLYNLYDESMQRNIGNQPVLESEWLLLNAKIRYVRSNDALERVKNATTVEEAYEEVDQIRNSGWINPLQVIVSEAARLLKTGKTTSKCFPTCRWAYDGYETFIKVWPFALKGFGLTFNRIYRISAVIIPSCIGYIFFKDKISKLYY